eukprot:461710-Hanusia_phi.AAC.4
MSLRMSYTAMVKALSAHREKVLSQPVGNGIVDLDLDTAEEAREKGPGAMVLEYGGSGSREGLFHCDRLLVRFFSSRQELFRVMKIIYRVRDEFGIDGLGVLTEWVYVRVRVEGQPDMFAAVCDPGCSLRTVTKYEHSIWDAQFLNRLYFQLYLSLEKLYTRGVVFMARPSLTLMPEDMVQGSLRVIPFFLYGTDERIRHDVLRALQPDADVHPAGMEASRLQTAQLAATWPTTSTCGGGSRRSASAT